MNPKITVPVADVDETAAAGVSSRMKRWRGRRAVILAGVMLLLAASSAMADLLGFPRTARRSTTTPLRESTRIKARKNRM